LLLAIEISSVAPATATASPAFTAALFFIFSLLFGLVRYSAPGKQSMADYFPAKDIVYKKSRL
jgi:hypothetical protein